MGESRWGFPRIWGGSIHLGLLFMPQWGVFRTELQAEPCAHPGLKPTLLLPDPSSRTLCPWLVSLSSPD